jgi:MBG domain (YGX type)
MDMNAPVRKDVLYSKMGLGFLVVALTAVSASSAAHAADRIRVLSGAEQQTSYMSNFPAPLVVWVSDPLAERPVAGVRVTFIAEPGIKLSSNVAITDERGIAQVNATGLTPCTSRVTAKAVGAHGEADFDSLVVTKATLTIVPEDEETMPGSLPEISEYRIRGFVNGENEDSAHVSGVPVLTTTANDGSHYGNYAIKGGVGTLTSPNYEFVPGFGTLAVVADPKSPNPLDRPHTASSDLTPGERAVTVHAAILQPLMTVLMAPAPVVDGLEAKLAPHAVMELNVTAAGSRRDAAVPVHAAIAGTATLTPKGMVLSAAEAVAPVTMPSAAAAAPAKAGVGVHAAIGVSAPASSSNAQFNYNGSAIKTGLLPAGTN